LKQKEWTAEEINSIYIYMDVARRASYASSIALNAVANKLKTDSSEIGKLYYNHLRATEHEFLREYKGDPNQEAIIVEELERLTRGIEEEKPKRRNWTQEELNLVNEKAEKFLEQDRPLTEAFKELHKTSLPHRTPQAIAVQYYKKRNQPEDLRENTNSEVEHEQPQTTHMSDTQVFGEVLPKPFIELIKMFKDLQEENDQLKANLLKMKESYDEAEILFNMFTNMASISQIMGLGDFKQQMRTTLDKWGNVVELCLERVTS